MSKSMWIDAIDVDCKPVRDRENSMRSVDVLFWIEGEKAPSWGYYDFNRKEWYTTYGPETSIIPNAEVHHYAYIDNPYK